MRVIRLSYILHYLFRYYKLNLKNKKKLYNFREAAKNLYIYFRNHLMKSTIDSIFKVRYGFDRISFRWDPYLVHDSFRWFKLYDLLVTFWSDKPKFVHLERLISSFSSQYIRFFYFFLPLAWMLCKKLPFWISNTAHMLDLCFISHI